jgi:hypothetical protein
MDSKKPEPGSPAAMLGAMEDTARFVSSMTGIKAQFVAQGWSELAAEQMVIVIARRIVGKSGD